MAEVRVIRPGLLTTVQDRGRWGYQAQGVPVAGPMDPRAHRTANALVGNDVGAATLEVTLIGPELEFEDERLVATAGAAFDLTVDGRTVPANASFIVASRLRFGRRVQGARAYVAIEGGIDVRPVFGSRATHVTSRLGGFDGRALRAGDRVSLGKAAGRAGRSGPLPAAASLVPVLLARGGSIRVLPGPQEEAFADGALGRLQSAPYTIDSLSDRMGYRLQGPVLRHRQSADIISDAAPLGALQVPASGQPILLMADRQTTGGYPKLATVISADIGVAGQLAPGDQIHFVVCSQRDALAALIAQERALMSVEDMWPR